MAVWTVGRGEGQSVRIEAVRTARGFKAGYSGEIFDAATGERIGSGQQYRDAATARKDTRRLVEAWWPAATIVG